MMGKEMKPSEFGDPPAAYRGVTLWMLNDRLEKDEIARQLRGFRKAGWGAVITRTFIGLMTPYLSDEWMEMLAEIVRVARQEGLKVWFQAGYMPSGVPDLPVGMAHKVIVRKPAGEVGGGKPVSADSIHAYHVESRPNVVDFLSREATADYLEIAYEKPWVRRFGREFGRTIEAIWVDEPHFSPQFLPWTEMLPKRFEKVWGYSLLPNLGSLFSDTGDFQKVRHHYWRVVLEMLLEGYFAAVRDWCERKGVKFAGHLMGEDTVKSQIGWTAAVMPCYKYMHLPGIDHLTMSLTWPSGKPFILTPKQCSSAANQLGRQEILAEMYGVSSQGITFEDRKRLGEWFAVLGINYRCCHGSFYSMRGRRKRIYVPHLSHQQPWWQDNRGISDSLARLSWSLRQGTFEADVLVIHPVESGFCVYQPDEMSRPLNRENQSQEIDDLDDSIVALSENLLRIHRGFDYGDETILARNGRIEGDRLVAGKMSYRAVILPSLITLRRSTVKLLEKFSKAGGTIFSAGRLPDRIDGIVDRRMKKMPWRIRSVPNDPAALKAALDEHAPADVELQAGDQGDPGNVWLHCRKLAGGRVIFLVNTSREAAVAARIGIRGNGRLESWDMRTGRAETLPQHREKDRTVVRIFFSPSESRLLVFRDGQAVKDVPDSPRRVLRSFSTGDAWRIRRHSPNALTLDWCRFRRGSEEWSEILPVICVNEILQQEKYDGPVCLEFRFHATDRPGQLRLVAEDAVDWKIGVNGRAVRYGGLPYYQDRAFLPVDITRQTVKGENVVLMSRQFSHLRAAKFGLSSLFENLPGTELESVYLTGDFAARGYPSSGEARPRCVRYGPSFTLAKEPRWTEGDLILDGYPFFAGRILLTGAVHVEVPKKGEKAVLVLPAFNATLAHVRINGKVAGDIAWSPYELDVTKLVRQGKNEIGIELVNTLRNLLGPHHRAKGETDSAWGHEFTFYPDWLQKPWDRRANWTDDYFFLPLGLPEGARIIIVRDG